MIVTVSLGTGCGQLHHRDENGNGNWIGPCDDGKIVIVK